MFLFAGLLDLRGATAGVKENNITFRFTWICRPHFVLHSPGNSGTLPSYIELEYFEEAVEWLCKHPKVLQVELVFVLTV